MCTLIFCAARCRILGHLSDQRGARRARRRNSQGGGRGNESGRMGVPCWRRWQGNHVVGDMVGCPEYQRRNGAIGALELGRDPG